MRTNEFDENHDDQRQSKPESITAREFDKMFDEGEDVMHLADIERAKFPNPVQKRVSVRLPLWMIQSLDREAQRLGMSRHSLIKLWLSERLDAQC